MRYAQLRAFDAVARARSFSRAAQMLGLTQPAISVQVTSLERAYRTDLIIRSGAQLGLTPEGEALFALTRQMFSTEAEIEDLLESTEALRRGHLRLGADGPHLALDLVALFRQRYPLITMELVLGNATQTLNAVLQSSVDIAIVANPPADLRLARQALITQDMMVLVPRGHAFQPRKQISLKDLTDQPLIFREHGSNTQRLLEAALKKAGLNLPPVLTVGSREAMIEAVSRGIGIGFIFNREQNEDPRSRAVPLRELRGSSRIMLIHLKPRRRRRAVQALLEVAKSFT
ncbi:MAG TPA: LysR substrate-binding domain-containing protein [Terriglobia bacterium]|nr:LysR substrate-binding domain-containing protein [Terriglobia bacterium]